MRMIHRIVILVRRRRTWVGANVVLEPLHEGVARTLLPLDGRVGDLRRHLAVRGDGHHVRGADVAGNTWERRFIGGKTRATTNGARQGDVLAPQLLVLSWGLETSYEETLLLASQSVVGLVHVSATPNTERERERERRNERRGK